MVTDELVEYISTKQVVTTEEITKQVEKITLREQKNSYVYKKFIYPLLKRKYLKRIRRNLYQVTTPGNRENPVDRFIVASTLRDDYYIGFHAALEFYGVAYSYRNTVHVGVDPSDRFDVFKYQGTVYRPYLTDDTKTGVITQQYRGNDVCVCSKERLFLECLRYPVKAGGWEEVLKSLQGLGGVDFGLLTEYLLMWDNQSLIRRTGFVLELLRDSSVFFRHLDDEVLRRIESHVAGDVSYLVGGLKGDLNKRWLLYVPPDFVQHLRGI